MLLAFQRPRHQHILWECDYHLLIHFDTVQSLGNPWKKHNSKPKHLHSMGDSMAFYLWFHQCLC